MTRLSKTSLPCTFFLAFVWTALAQGSDSVRGTVTIQFNDPAGTGGNSNDIPNFPANQSIPLSITFHNSSDDVWYLDDRMIRSYNEYRLHDNNLQTINAFYRDGLIKLPSNQMLMVLSKTKISFNVELCEIFGPTIDNFTFPISSRFVYYGNLRNPGEYQLTYEPTVYGKGTPEDPFAPSLGRLTSNTLDFRIREPDSEGLKPLETKARDPKARLEDRVDSFVKAVYVYPKLTGPLIEAILHDDDKEFARLAGRAKVYVTRLDQYREEYRTTGRRVIFPSDEDEPD